MSHLDYCNCLLYGIPKYLRNKLQRLQKYRGVSCDGSKTFRSCDAYTNWLTVEKRIEFNILLITHKTIHAQSADWLKPLSEMYQPSWSLKQENNKNEEEEEVNNNAQSIPRVPIPLAFVGNLSFCFGKAANAPRRNLEIGCKCPTPGQHQNCIFHSKNCK